MSLFKKYEYVLAVSQYGGISQAAEALGIAQPTLSKFIKKLEIDIGAEIFDRSTVPLTITPAGELFLEAGKRMLDVERQFEKELQELLSNKNTIIRIGISPSRSPYMMPGIIKSYKSINPSVQVIIEEKTTTELNNRLAEGKLDLIITLANEDTQNFMCIPLFEEDILLAVPNVPEYSHLSTVDILRSLPLINVGRGQAMWQTTNAITDALKIKKPDIECQSIESGVAMVRHGLGAMIVPSYIADFGTQLQKANISFLPFSQENREKWELPMERRVCLFYRKEQFLTQSEKDFINCANDFLKEHQFIKQYN